MRTIIDLAWLLVLCSLSMFLMSLAFGTRAFVGALGAIPWGWLLVTAGVVAAAVAGTVLILRLRSRKKWYQFWK